MDRPVNQFEYEKLAQARLSSMAYDYYAGGAMTFVAPEILKRLWVG